MSWSPHTRLTREEIVWLFRSILGRDPDEGAIQTFLDRHPHFASVRNDLLYSIEFYLMIKDRLSDFQVTYCACDYPQRKLDIRHKRQTLCLVCIVKDEADHIERMIRSCLPIIDHIVMVDTGSTDNSIELARSCSDGIPIEVHRVKFEDFSQARNIALDFALGKTDWILAMDADEYFVEEDLAELLHLTNYNNGVDGWRLPRYNFLDESLPARLHHYPDYQRRLFKNSAKMRYVGRVHELLEGVTNWGFAPVSMVPQGGSCGGPHIHHSGLIDRLKAQRKFEFYQSLGHLI